MPGDDLSTREPSYSDRLERLQRPRWKRWLDVQAPYRWNLRRLRLGPTLEVGCGIGRNLEHLGGEAVGVDHNPRCVEVARQRGLEAYTPEELLASPRWMPGAFRALLFAHVLEHMDTAAARELIGSYLPALAADGRLVLITPQEAGFRSDPTHVELMGFERLESLLGDHGLVTVRRYSFPFPRPAGKLFKYNEFVVIGQRPARVA